MGIRVVADSVELQIGVTQSRFGGLPAEFLAFRELDPVRRGLDAVVAYFAGVANRFQEVRRKRRLAAGELHRHLALRLDGDGVIEQRLDVFPGQFVDEPDLVRVHETRIAHHVAAVGQVNCEHRAAAVRDGAGAMLVELFVVVRANVAAGERFFQMFEERRVDGHHVLKVAVLGAILHHDDFAVALDDGGFDFAHLFVEQDLVRQFSVDDLLPDFGNAARAQRIGLARPA